MKIKFAIIILTLNFLSCRNTEGEQAKENNASSEKLIDVKQIPDGDFVQNHLSGNLKMKGKMLNNERDGLWVAYYENGVKQSESTYLNGTLHGRTASFYENGQVRYIGYFFGGKKDGKWDFYLKEGELDKNEIYVKGELSK